MFDEEKCDCGFSIPKGYGYYNYGKPVRCFGCGKINQVNEQKRRQNKMKKTKLNHIKLAWTCDNCNYLTISDSREHHKMDNCPCGQCGVDLEEYSCRFSFGDKAMPRVIAQLKDGDKWRYVKQCKKKKTKKKIKQKKKKK